MAISKDAAADFIQDTFRPLVGVLCSDEAERLCQKNNLSFVKLIEPFCTIAEGNIKDYNNTGHNLKNFKIVCHDLNELSVSKLLSKKKLNDIISRSYNLDIQNKHASHLGIPLGPSTERTGSQSKKSERSSRTPWYESYRKCFLESLPYTEHEYLRHYVACIIVISTSEPNPLNELNTLHQSPNPSHLHPSMVQPNTLLHEAKWFVPTILKFIVLLHDTSEQDDMKAESVYQAVKEKFGNQHCHLLHINSKLRIHHHGNLDVAQDEKSFQNNPWVKFAAERHQEHKDASYSHENDPSQNSSSTNPNHPLADHPLMTSSPHPIEEVTKVKRLPGSCLTASDMDRIIIFVSEFITHSLFPWAEKTLKNLNDQTSMRKGIKGSIFNAGRWFGRTRQGQAPSTSSVVYSSESLEMLLRRLADLCFLFQLYELAYQTYHALKKDFQSDNSPIHFSGSIEMAFLSSYLLGPLGPRQYPCDYMNQAVKSYGIAQSLNFASRAIMFSTEMLRSRNHYRDAADQFTTFTIECLQDNDLLSALFLEQKAHCFLDKNMTRQFAFHMVLAGHRFNKAGQKKHVLRCYAEALEVFKGKGWSLAEDHIYLTIGSQAYNIRELSLATSAYVHLLSPNSKQSANQQAVFFAQYLNIYKQLVSSSSPSAEMPRKQFEILPLPLVDGKFIKVTSQPSQDGKVLSSGISLDEEDDERESSFAQLEERLAGAANQDPLSSRNFFKPSIFCHSQRTDNSSNVLAVVGEPITIEMVLENPLKIPLVLLNVHPLWKFSPHFRSSSSPCRDGHDDDDDLISNEPSFHGKMSPDQLDCVRCVAIPELQLEGSETKKQLRISITCQSHGTLHVTGLAFQLMTSPLKSPPQNGGTAILDVVGSTGSSSISGSSSFVSISNEHDNSSSGWVLPNGFLTHTQSLSPIPPTATLSTQSLSPIPPTPSTLLVSGMIRLEVRGNRQNSTKEEKLNVVYAVDRRLHFHVLPVTTRLQMCVSNLPTSMLCGEVVQSELEFTNCGRSHVTKLFVSSNQMEMLSFRDDDAVVVPKRKGILKIILPKEGLAPGQSITKVMKVKCHELSGKHPVDLLALYVGGDDDDECKKLCAKMRYRLIRHSACIKAEASLIVASQILPSLLSASPSFSDDDVIDGGCPENGSVRRGVNVSLKVDNINQDYDFSIAKIFCISRHWGLKFNECLDVKKNQFVQPGEYHLLALKVYKENDDEHGKDMVSSLLLSDEEEPIEIFDPQGSSTHSPVVDPPPVMRGYHKQSVANDDRLTVLGKAAETKFRLVIIWKAALRVDGSRRYGRHVLSFNKMEELVESVPVPKIPLSVPQVKFTPSHVLESPTEPSVGKDVVSQLVRMSFMFDPCVRHDFAAKKSCIAHVKVTLLNCSNLNIFVSIETDDIVMRQPITDQHRPSNKVKSFVWAGRSKISLHLQPNHSSSHTLKAQVFQPGIYDLSSIKTFVSVIESGKPGGDDDIDESCDIPLKESKRDGTSGMLQKSSNPVLLTVVDASDV